MVLDVLGCFLVVMFLFFKLYIAFGSPGRRKAERRAKFQSSVGFPMFGSTTAKKSSIPTCYLFFLFNGTVFFSLKLIERDCLPKEKKGNVERALGLCKRSPISCARAVTHLPLILHMMLPIVAAGGASMLLLLFTLIRQ